MESTMKCKEYCIDCGNYDAISGFCRHPYKQLEYGKAYGHSLPAESECCEFFSQKKAVNPRESVYECQEKTYE